jgi:hypothetical protein
MFMSSSIRTFRAKRLWSKAATLGQIGDLKSFRRATAMTALPYPCMVGATLVVALWQ